MATNRSVKEKEKKGGSDESETYSLIRCGSDKGKELSQQHTVRWFVTAVLYGQRLQQGE